MSKTTLRKRIALTATTALFAGMLSVASAPVASAAVLHSGTVGTSTANPVVGAESSDTTTYVATTANTGGAAVLATVGNTVVASISVAARSTRLLAKDT